MTTARKFDVMVPPNRVVQLPDGVPLGRITLVIESASSDALSLEERRLARKALWGSMPELEALGTALLSPMTDDELASWDGPIEPTQ